MKRSVSILVAALVTGGIALGQGIAPADVSYDEYGAIAVSLSGQAGSVEAGEKIMTTRGKGNCIACHQVTALEEHPFHGEVGPPLNGVADRYTQADLRGIVANAKMTFEGSVMPAFFKNSGYVRPGIAYTGKAAGPDDLFPILTAQEVEDVVAYLLTLSE